jgi:protein TonB
VKTSVPGLDQAAQRAVRQWHFKPARHGGAPVAVWAVVPVKFSLQPDAPAPKR